MSDFNQSPLNQNHQQAWGHNAQSFGPNGQGWGPGAGAGNPFGQAWGYGQGLGQAAFGQNNYGGAGGWSQGQGFGNPWQRQLSPQDVGEIVRQLVPFLPQVVAQAQQPQAAYGYGGFNQNQGGFGQGGGFGQRHLSQHDVNEVVRQILPVIPQIVSLLQGQQQPYASAIYGGLGNSNQLQGWGGNPYAQGPYAQGSFGQQQSPFGLAAFGGNAGGYGQNRQLNQADVNEVVRQLTAALPQVIANLQALHQNQHQQRAA